MLCLRASDLGLGHDIEVVVVGGEGHVSEDGSVVHRLHRLVLQSQRGAVYTDLEKKNSKYINTEIQACPSSPYCLCCRLGYMPKIIKNKDCKRSVLKNQSCYFECID